MRLIEIYKKTTLCQPGRGPRDHGLFLCYNFHMPIRLQVNNTTSSPVGDDFFQKVAERTLTEAGFDFLKNNKEIFISLALVAPEEIRRLNKEYRKYDSVTDVLSFAEYKSAAALKKAVDKSSPPAGGVAVFLGELILCYDDVREYARKNKIGLHKELAKVVSHGVLHLLGMQHGKKMFEIQNKIVNKNKNARGH